MPPDPLEHKGEGPVTYSRRQQDHLQIQSGVEYPVAQRKAGPAQQADRHHTAAEGAGKGHEKDPLTEQPAAPAVGDQEHQDSGGDAACRMGQEGQPRQEDRHSIHPSQDSPQSEAPTAEGLPGQPGRSQQEEVVHQSVEEEQSIDVDDRHSSPSFRHVLL